MVAIVSIIAKKSIRYQNADLMYLFLVYEEKLKEGAVVYKVLLVADGQLTTMLARLIRQRRVGRSCLFYFI